MEIIRHPIGESQRGLGEVLLRVDRHTLAKRRWRSTAENGHEFGFDLEEPLADGTAFFETEAHSFRIAQTPEPVLELRIADRELREEADAARIGWMIGNLHFPLEITESLIRVPDDPALRALFEREHISFESAAAVFHPLRAAHSHAH